MATWEISSFGWSNITGVYCVCSKDENRKTIVHYIGSSKNIGKRILNNSHPYKILFNKGVGVFIKFKETPDYLELEQKMINKIKPIMNIHYT